MNLFGTITDVNRAHCAALGIKTDAYGIPVVRMGTPVPGSVNATLRKAAELDKRPPAITRPDDFYAETTGGALAYEWIARCQRSEADALEVLSEMDSQDDFMAKVFHMLSNVETRTDRSKVINELVDSFEGALLAAANHE